jgi:hypothetical protein
MTQSVDSLEHSLVNAMAWDGPAFVRLTFREVVPAKAYETALGADDNMALS